MSSTLIQSSTVLLAGNLSEVSPPPFMRTTAADCLPPTVHDTAHVVLCIADAAQELSKLETGDVTSVCGVACTCSDSLQAHHTSTSCKRGCFAILPLDWLYGQSWLMADEL